MRIGTWNLEGRWSADHAEVLQRTDCDVWLLTEVRPRVILAGYEQHLSTGTTADGVHWAGILARRTLVPDADPGAASVAARIDGQLFCCSVLPWPLMGTAAPWPGNDHSSQMAAAVEEVGGALARTTPVWGGDWNQPLGGNIIGFSRRAQEMLRETVSQLGLVVPTATLPARGGMQQSIDHVAVPATWDVLATGRVTVADEVSDHDAYWVDALRPRR